MDWQPGDLALCVKMGEWRRILTGQLSNGPSAGVVLTVRSVHINHKGWLCLKFSDYPDPAGRPRWPGFSASRFRKITPGADIEGIEEPRRIPVEA